MNGHPLVNRVVFALEKVDREYAAAGLAAFGQIARVLVPTRGIALMGDEAENDIYEAVERIARQNFGLKEAKRKLEKSLSSVEKFAEREAIMTAAHDVSTVYDEAYYYMGLAMGLVASPYCGSRAHLLLARGSSVRPRKNRG